MSYSRAQTNGYLNGTSPDTHLRRFDFGDSSRDTSADERSRSRPGGYGGFNQPPEHVHGVARLDRGHANRRSRDYQRSDAWSASRSRSRPANRDGGPSAASDQVEQILRYIEQHWGFMSSENMCSDQSCLTAHGPKFARSSRSGSAVSRSAYAIAESAEGDRQRAPSGVSTRVLAHFIRFRLRFGIRSIESGRYEQG